MSDSGPSFRLLRASQAAAAMGVTVGTLAKMRLTGRGPAFVRVGRAICYNQRELERWLEARTFSSTSEAAAAAIDVP
ncbi:MAG TPA: helix-turn-helix domain-containing protein [Nitrospira sp.]